MKAGVWDSRETLDLIRGKGELFTRQEEGRERGLEEYNKWLQACRRFTLWHSTDHQN